MSENGENVVCRDCGLIWPASRNFCTNCGSMLPSADPNEINHHNENGGGSE